LLALNAIRLPGRSLPPPPKAFVPFPLSNASLIPPAAWPMICCGRAQCLNVHVDFPLPRLCGPLANSRFHHQPDSANRPNSKLEAAYHKADRAIEKIVSLLAAA
jgi:hypothetical protein